MIRRSVRVLLSLLCLMLLAATPVRAAESVLKLVPDSALGFVVVHRLAATDAKLQDLGRQMQLPVPSMLALFKAEANVKEGLDEAGATALFFLPPKDGQAKPVMMLLIPVTDYKKFIGQFNPADASATTTTIHIGDAETVVRSLGGYAVMTQSGNRETLEKSISLAATAPTALAPLESWLAEQDAAGVLTAPGIKLFSEKGQEKLKEMKAMFAQIAANAGGGANPMAKQMKQAAAAFDMYAMLLRTMEKETRVLGLGVLYEKGGALRVTKLVRLSPQGDVARVLKGVQPAKRNLLAGLPAEPFVVAAGGVLPEGFSDEMIKVSADMMKSMPDLYGLTEKQVDEMVKLSPQSLKNIRSGAFLMALGKPGDQPIFAGAVAVMRVDDSQQYMADYEKTVQKYAAFVKEANNPMLTAPEVEKATIGGRDGYKFTMHFPAASTQGNPQGAKALEAMFGPGGKMVGWLVAADKHTLAAGYVKQEALLETLKTLKSRKGGLVADADLSKTAALLPPAPWVLYVSPKGLFGFIKGLMGAVLPVLPPQVEKILDFPQTPPIGIAIVPGEDEVRSTIVLPAETIQGIGRYVKTVKGQIEKPQTTE